MHTVFVTATVTGRTFGGKERGALNNECKEPRYTADKPLKRHDLMPRLSWHHQWADGKTMIKRTNGGSAGKKRKRKKTLN